MTEWLETMPYVETTLWDQGAVLTFDGDGRIAKRLKRNRNRAGGNETWLEDPEYYIHSSVTGQKITELDAAGEKQKTSIYLGSTEVAESGPTGGPTFLVSDPVTHSSNKTEASGAVFANDGGRVELEALGGVLLPDEGELQVPQYHQGGSVVNPEYGCADPLLGPMPYSTAAAYQNYLGRLESTLERIRRLNNPPPPLPDGPDPDGNPWTVRAEDAAGVSRYNGWEWQTFPDDWIFADNQRHDHPGLEWKYLGLVNDSEQWGWRAAFPQDFFSIDYDRLRDGITEFFTTYGQRFRRCVWQVFATDSGGNKSNVADIMPTPTSKNFAYSTVRLYDEIRGAQAFHNKGEVGLRKTYGPVAMRDGSTVSAKESFFRNVAHEYANYLSWFHTGDSSTFGTLGGIPGDATPGDGLPSAHWDPDTGARMEKCIWGNVSY